MAVASALIGLAGGAIASGLQARSQGKAQKAQDRAYQDAMQREQAKEAEGKKRKAANWKAYESAYRNWYSRYGDQGINRYGVPVGIDLAKPGAGGTPGAPGSPGSAPAGPEQQITLGGGRTVPKSEYDAYVANREARRGGGAPSPAPGGGFGGTPPPPPVSAATIGDMIQGSGRRPIPTRRPDPRRF